MCYQLSSVVQLYTAGYMKKASVAAYHLYLTIGDILSLSDQLPEECVHLVYRRKVMFCCCISVRSSLKLTECNEWFNGFVNDWVTTACNIFHADVERSSEESHKVRHVIFYTCYHTQFVPKAFTVVGEIQISHSAVDVSAYIQQVQYKAVRCGVQLGL